MKILVLTNFYPPHYLGGYELGCRDVVEGLKRRGHEVRVLTSDYGSDKPRQAEGVYRLLDTDFPVDERSSTPFRLLRKELTNKRAFGRVCRAFKPDVVYVWNAAHISISNVFLARRMGLPVCYFVSDHWLSEWESDLWYARTRGEPRRWSRKLAWLALSPLLNASGLRPEGSLDFSHAQFVSQFLKGAAVEAGKPARSAEVIHWGVDVDRFSANGSSRDPSKLLYVGQITAHKGVHTAIEALKILRDHYGCGSVSLTIVGGPDYDRRIERLVATLRLEASVRFTGLVSRERLPDLYRRHGTLVFPSVWDEPFSITVLEAMSSGLAVVGTNSGGSAEILADGVNSLVFPKEDARGCARQIKRLIDDPRLFESVRQNGRQTVREKHRLESMLDKIESSLGKLIG